MSVLKKAWNKWKIIARKIGDFQARLLLTVLYFTAVLPYGIAVRLFSDPLRIKKTTVSNWLDKKPLKSDLESLRKQF